MLQSHQYNCTYSHSGISFESSLLDAYTQLQTPEVNHVLVGAHDEMTPELFKVLGHLKYWKEGIITEDRLKKAEEYGSISGSCSVSMVFGKKKTTANYCKLDGLKLGAQPKTQALNKSISELLEPHYLKRENIDALMLGLSGDAVNDANYRHFAQTFFPQTPILWYKPIFGESLSSSAFGVYAAAMILKQQEVPSHLLYHTEKALKSLQHILVYHHFKNREHSLILLSSC